MNGYDLAAREHRKDAVLFSIAGMYPLAEAHDAAATLLEQADESERADVKPPKLPDCICPAHLRYLAGVRIK